MAEQQNKQGANKSPSDDREQRGSLANPSNPYDDTKAVDQEKTDEQGIKRDVVNAPGKGDTPTQ
jgi:hypothetical protein